MTDLRTIVALRRQELGISQSALARTARVDRAALNGWEMGHNDLNGDTITRLLTALGCRGILWGRPPESP